MAFRGGGTGGAPFNGVVHGGVIRSRGEFGGRNTNDQRIRRFRGPWMHASYYIPPPQNEVNWTMAGPSRLEMHMRHRTFAPQSGTELWPEGMHSNPAVALARTQDTRNSQPRMRPPRQNRITVQRFKGQSYSQTTQVQ